MFTKPSYQSGVTPDDKVRDVPDVAFGASPNSPGFSVFLDVSGQPEQSQVGGTSIAAPMWAGLAKLLSQKARPSPNPQLPNPRFGNMNPILYKLGGLSNTNNSGVRDVTAGTNSYNGVAGFAAGSG